MRHALRLDRQHHDVAAPHDLDVGFEDGHAGLGLQECRAAGSGSLAQIESTEATPARINPLTSAVAILPAPMKPQPNSDFAGLATLETSLMNLPRKRLRAIVLFLPDCNNSWVKPG